VISQEADARPQVQNAAALQGKFNQGVALQQQGKLADAERIYREVLRERPDHFGALHLLGVISLQTRHTEQAFELLQKAIARNANAPRCSH
jgi:Flp pilus assembly protein TadD